MTNNRRNKRTRFKTRILWLLLHALCLTIYIVPVFVTSRNHNRRDPVLDELHIVSQDNQDVNGESTLRQIFTNDYWGRPMHSPSSHKSWRPLTVLSLRYFKGGHWIRDIDAHRCINILLHAATADAVSVIAAQLLPSHYYYNNNDDDDDDTFGFRVMVKLLFALHPTHVEVTANAANRGHLLAVLCSVAAADPNLHWVLLVVVVMMGYLSSETFLFQVIPSAVTLTAIVHIRMRQMGNTSRNMNTWSQWTTLIRKVFGRVFFLISSGFVYYAARHYFDTLSIPDGLIRPAENPFFTLTGWDRLRNYAYVLSLHIGKAWDLDWVGFSHEYGHECIRPVVEWQDPRLYIPLFVMIIYILAGLVALLTPLSIFFWWFVVHVAWITTLFPISGIVKVGTFISDRIVVAASVSTCLCYGWLLWAWIKRDGPLTSPAYLSRTEKRILFGLIVMVMYRRVYNRSLEWMDSLALLESSLKTCPRFAKAHLEISKIYSGLYPEKWNLTRSLFHISEAQKYDPGFCDVHYQYAHVALQQHRYMDFEKHLVDALRCPFTMGGAMHMWNQYWSAVLEDSPQNTVQTIAAARSRYESYMKIINQAILEEEKDLNNEHKKSSSPFAKWARSDEF